MGTATGGRRRGSDFVIHGLERVGLFAHCMTDQYEIGIDCSKRRRYTEETLNVFHGFIFMRIRGFLTCILRDRLLFHAFCNAGTNESGPLPLLFLLDGSQVGLRIQCLGEKLDTKQKTKRHQAKRAHSSSSNEKLLSEPASLVDHTNEFFHGPLIHSFHKCRRYSGQIRLEWSTIVVKFLIIHVLSPIEETARRNLGKDLRAREQLDDLLLQARQDIVLGQAHEFLELPKALTRGGLVLGQQEFVLVEELEHLLEGNSIVGH